MALNRQSYPSFERGELRVAMKRNRDPVTILTDANFDVNQNDFVLMFTGNYERSQARRIRNQSHQCKQKRVHQVSNQPNESDVAFTLSTCLCVVGVLFKAGINLMWEKVLECIVPD